MWPTYNLPATIYFPTTTTINANQKWTEDKLEKKKKLSAGVVGTELDWIGIELNWIGPDGYMGNTSYRRERGKGWGILCILLFFSVRFISFMIPPRLGPFVTQLATFMCYFFVLFLSVVGYHLSWWLLGWSASKLVDFGPASCSSQPVDLLAAYSFIFVVVWI